MGPTVRSTASYNKHQEYSVDLFGNELTITITSTPSVIRRWIRKLSSTSVVRHLITLSWSESTSSGHRHIIIIRRNVTILLRIHSSYAWVSGVSSSSYVTATMSPTSSAVSSWIQKQLSSVFGIVKTKESLDDLNIIWKWENRLWTLGSTLRIQKVRVWGIVRLSRLLRDVWVIKEWG